VTVTPPLNGDDRALESAAAALVEGKGFTRDDLDRFVRLAEAAAARLEGDISGVRQSSELAHSEPEVVSSEEEALLGKTVLVAQRAADRMMSEARVRADRILAEAETRVSEIVTETHQQAAAVVSEARRLLADSWDGPATPVSEDRKRLMDALDGLTFKLRGHGPVAPTGDLVLDPSGRSALVAGTRVELSARHFSLLQALVAHGGQVVGRAALAEHGWGHQVAAGTVDAAIRALRTRLESAPSGQCCIRTVRGVGYRLEFSDVPETSAGGYHS